MVPDQQDARQISYRNRLGVGKALDGEKRLMLLRRQSRFVGGRFAEGQELSKLIAKFGKRSVVDGRRCSALGCSLPQNRFTLLSPHSRAPRPMLSRCLCNTF